MTQGKLQKSIKGKSVDGLFTEEYFLELVEEAKKELFDSLCSWCYNENEFGCWTRKKKSVENCPRNKLEKWFGKHE